METMEEQKIIEFNNLISNCQDSILIRDYVKILKNDGVLIGQNQMFKWLKMNEFIYRDTFLNQWLPYKKHIDNGLFKLTQSFHNTPYGKRSRNTIRITIVGQKYFYEKLKVIFCYKEVV